VLLRYHKIYWVSFMCCGPGFARYLLAIETAYVMSPLILSMMYIRDLIMCWYVTL
jgi:hypothetical protein